MQYLNFGIARFTGRRQLLQILLPVMVLPFRQIAQVAPAVEPRVVAVVEGDLHRVVSNGFNAGDGHRGFSGLQDFLPRTVTSDLSRGGEDTQKFGT